MKVRIKRTKTYAYKASAQDMYMSETADASPVRLISMYELAHCFCIVDLSLLF